MEEREYKLYWKKNIRIGKTCEWIKQHSGKLGFIEEPLSDVVETPKEAGKYEEKASMIV